MTSLRKYKAAWCVLTFATTEGREKVLKERCFLSLRFSQLESRSPVAKCPEEPRASGYKIEGEEKKWAHPACPLCPRLGPEPQAAKM